MSPAPANPQVTVAIVAYQSGAFLQACLDALAAQTYSDFEAVIVDNDSTDGSIEALSLPDARFRVERMGKNLGFPPLEGEIGNIGFRGGCFIGQDEDQHIADAHSIMCWLFKILLK